MHSISLSTKLTLTLLLVITLLCTSFGFMALRTYEYALINQGRSLARQIMLFRHWVAGYDGIWSKNKYTKDLGYLLSFKSDEGTTMDSTDQPLATSRDTTFFLHNPALATRELSNLSREKYGWTVRVVSDRNMSPQSAVDPFEKEALAAMRDSGEDEFWGWDGTVFRFTSGLRVIKECLQCHGSDQEISSTTMQALKAKYNGNVEQATGYRTGELRGLISISILPPQRRALLKLFLDLRVVVPFVLALFLLRLFIGRSVIKRLRQLVTAVLQAGVGEIPTDHGLRVESLEMEKTADEISRLALALRKLPGMDQAFSSTGNRKSRR